jgi:hypothetical protein
MSEEQHSGAAEGGSKLVEIDVGSWYRVRDARRTRRRVWLSIGLIAVLAVAAGPLVAVMQNWAAIWSPDTWRFLRQGDHWFGILAALLLVWILIAIVNWIIRRWHRVALAGSEYEPELREAVIAPFGKPVSEIWSRVQSFKVRLGGRGASASGLRNVLLLATAALFVGAAGIFLFVIVYPPIVRPSPEVDRIYSILFNVALVAILASPLLATLVRRVTMPSSRSMREQDRRKPVLFLRSFVDDELTVSRTVRVLDGWQRIELRFEEAIANELAHYGPFLAIGRPGEWLPRTGAAREYVGEDEWRSRVSALADEALVVVVSLGRSEGMEWELRHLIARGQIGKVIVFIPPRGHRPLLDVLQHFKERPLLDVLQQHDSTTTGNRGISGVDIFEWNDRKERWRKLSAYFVGTQWAEGLQQADVTSALAALFLPDGKVAVIQSDRSDERDYCLAIAAAMYRIYCSAPPDGEQTQPA